MGPSGASGGFPGGGTVVGRPGVCCRPCLPRCSRSGATDSKTLPQRPGGRPLARWSRWMVRIGFLYGLFTLIALFLIAWGLGAIDPWALLGAEELPLPEAVGRDPTPDTAADFRRWDPHAPISAAHPEGSAPTGAWPSPFPSPHPTLPPDLLPTPTRETTPSLMATALSRPHPLASPTPSPGLPFPGPVDPGGSQRSGADGL